MIKQYLKQAWRTLCENLILSAISIIATALAITMIMVMLTTRRVETDNFAPESNRNRTLYIQTLDYHRSDGDNETAGINLSLYQELLAPLESAEAVALISQEKYDLMLPNYEGQSKGKVLRVNLDYFRALDFSFLYGEGFNPADMEEGAKKAIVSEGLAKKMFHQSNVVGMDLLINYVEYRIIGVVSTPSNLLGFGYSEVWIPYTSMTTTRRKATFSGEYSAIILANSPSEYPTIKGEFNQLLAQYNAKQKEIQISANNGEGLQTWVEVYEFDKYFMEPESKSRDRTIGIVMILLFLIVPAINLSVLTYSRYEQRIGEQGLRRAYGASRISVLSQVIIESFLYTLIGGILGFFLSILSVYGLRGILFMGWNRLDVQLPVWQLFDVSAFVVCLLFCLLLNLLASTIPGLLMSRKSILHSLSRR